MATTEAQKRAKAKREAAKVTGKVVKLYPGNEGLLAHLEKQPRNIDVFDFSLSEEDMAPYDRKGG